MVQYIEHTNENKFWLKMAGYKNFTELLSNPPLPLKYTIIESCLVISNDIVITLVYSSFTEKIYIEKHNNGIWVLDSHEPFFVVQPEHGISRIRNHHWDIFTELLITIDGEYIVTLTSGGESLEHNFYSGCSQQIIDAVIFHGTNFLRKHRL